ncbi:hypothetical protein V5O48_006305, partial [Marasmius crinis-equi]
MATPDRFQRDFAPGTAAGEARGKGESEVVGWRFSKNEFSDAMNEKVAIGQRQRDEAAETKKGVS